MSSPRVKIPVHVFVFGVGIAPALAYAAYYQRNAPNDDEMEKLLKERYSDDIKKTQARREKMQEHFNAFKTDDQTTNEKYANILHGGKSTMKRMYRVDEGVLGTEEGAQRAAEEMKKVGVQQDVKKKKRKKKKIQSGEKQQEEQVPASADNKHETEVKKVVNLESGESTDTSTPMDVSKITAKKGIFTIVTVGALASAAGFIFGRSNGSSR
mmetsp:Transcript_40691/g.49526  ORF Transcript_40691/g.49526 Transcript_40691/m.49526 type:complete len:211 (+) Transcript_40691:101-733(+)